MTVKFLLSRKNLGNSVATELYLININLFSSQTIVISLIVVKLKKLRFKIAKLKKTKIAKI